MSCCGVNAVTGTTNDFDSSAWITSSSAGSKHIPTSCCTGVTYLFDRWTFLKSNFLKGLLWRHLHFFECLLHHLHRCWSYCNGRWGVSSSSSCFEEAQWQVQWDVYQRSGGHLQKERKSLDLNWGKWSCVQCCDVITMFMSSSLVLYMHGFKGVLGTISKCDACNFNKFVFNLRCYFMR